MTNRIQTKSIRSLWKDQRGVSAIEFSLVLPVFLGMMFGIVEFSRVAFTHASMKHAMQDVAREIMVDETVDLATIKSNAKGKMKGIDSSKLTVASSEVINGDGTDTVTLNATYAYPLVVPMFYEGTININVSVSAIQPSS